MLICTLFMSLLAALGSQLLDNHDSLTQCWLRLCHEVGTVRNYWSQSGEWWSRIGERRLILGPQLLREREGCQAMRALNVTSIISLQEDFERAPGWFFTPESHCGAKYWLPIAVADHAPLEPASWLHDQVIRLATRLEAGETVYVHCRAGVGRSASLVIAYLMYTEDVDFWAAYAIVKQWRHQISPNAAQRSALLQYRNWLDLWHALKK